MHENGLPVGRSHVSLPWCVSFAAQMYSRSHRGTDGMTGYRRAYGRSTVSRRFAFFGKKKCSTWSSPRERSKLKQDGTRGFSLGSRTNPREQLWARHTESFCARSIRRVPKEDSGDGLLFNSIKGVPWDLQLGEVRERERERVIVNRVQLDVRAAVPEAQAPPPTTG